MSEYKLSSHLWAVLMLAVFCSSPSIAVDNEWVIENVSLIPMTSESESALPDHSVVIRGGKIVRICASQDVCEGNGGTRINGSGKYLIPGLTDMHAHLDSTATTAPAGQPRPAELLAIARRAHDQLLRQYLAFGVTTVRDTGGGPENLSARQDIAEGKRLGPRIFTSLMAMDGDPPLMDFGQTRFSDPEKAKAFVFETAALGYDMVKIYTTLKPEVLFAVLEAAKETGQRVGGHVPMQVPLEHALQGGFRSIEHLTGYDVECARGRIEYQPILSHIYQGWAYCTPDRIRQLAELTARFDVWVDPTLIAVNSLVLTDYEMLSGFNPAAQPYIPPILGQFTSRVAHLFSPQERAAMQGTFPVRLAIVKALADAGVPLLTGTDTMAAGFDIHRELALFVQAGLSPYQALEASTAEPARYFEKEGKFGTIVVGASADLVLLDENPLEDISHTRSITGVMVRGDWMPADRIAQIMADLQAEYDDDRAMLQQQAADQSSG